MNPMPMAVLKTTRYPMTTAKNRPAARNSRGTAVRSTPLILAAFVSNILCHSTEPFIRNLSSRRVRVLISKSAGRFTPGSLPLLAWARRIVPRVPVDTPGVMRAEVSQVVPRNEVAQDLIVRDGPDRPAGADVFEQLAGQGITASRLVGDDQVHAGACVFPDDLVVGGDPVVDDRACAGRTLRSSPPADSRPARPRYGCGAGRSPDRRFA